MKKIGILWQLISYTIGFYGMHKATYEIYLENYKDVLGWEYAFILILVLLDLFYVIYILDKLANAFSEKKSFFSLLPIIIGILFAIALNFAIQYNILFDYEKEAFMNIQPECWYKDLANFFFFYSFSVLTSSIITQIAAASILAKVLVSLEVLSAFIFIILIIGNYKVIGESLSNCDFFADKNNKKE